VLSAIGGYYVPGMLKSGGEVVTNRAPLDYDISPGREGTPNFVFPPSSEASGIPLDILEGSPANFVSWARRQGGIRAQEDAFRIVLRGREESPVIINGLAGRVLATRTPHSGWFNGWDGCGAAVDTRQVDIDLNRKPPSTTWYDENGEKIDPLTLQVSATDHEVIDVYAYTSRVEVEWVLEVSYTSAGKDGILRIDDHGRPFVLTALDNAVGYMYAGGRAGLERDPELDLLARQGEPVC
jgi:hypothetical protein